jgi:tetratricopeptide (TPR) repeat protein
MALLAIGAGIAAWIARLRTIEAEQRLEWALETAGAVTTKAASFKNKFGVPAPVLSELLQEVERLLGHLETQGVNSPQLTLRDLLSALADSNHSLGNTTKALEQAQQSASRLAGLRNEKDKSLSNDSDLAWAHLKIGDLLEQQNKMSAAKEQYLAAKQLLDATLVSELNSLPLQSTSASTLSRLADVFIAEGNMPEAQRYSDEGVAIMRRLATNSSDNYYPSSLAIFLNKRGTISQLSNDIAGASRFFKESLDINERLAKIDPTNKEWLGQLATSYGNVGYAIDRQGNLSESLKYYTAAREKQKILADLDPTNVTVLDQLAGHLDSLGYVYQRMGRSGDALVTYNEMTTVRRKMLSQDPADASQKMKLTISLMRVSACYHDLGDVSKAWSASEEALKMGAEVVQSDPSNTNHKILRVVHLGVAAINRDDIGDPTGATSAIEEMVALSDQLADGDPTNGIKTYGAGIARTMLGVRYRLQGRLKDALESLIVARDRIERMRSTSPGDVNNLLPLTNIYEQIYLVYWALDDMAAATEAANKFLEIAKLWQGDDIGNREASQRLATAYTVVGNSARRLGKLNDAHVAIASSIDIRQKLVEFDPNNVTFGHDLSISWSRLYYVYWEEANYSEALNAQQRAIALLQKLVAAHPTNFEMQSDLAESYACSGNALRRLDRTDEARNAYETALAIRRQMATARPSDRDVANAVAWTIDRLAELKEQASAKTP